MFITIILSALTFSTCRCFNIDVNSPVVYLDPLRNTQSTKSSYFGYSLVLYPGGEINKSWILIGAPRGNRASTTVNSGVGFKCGIKKSCEILDFLTIDSPFFPKNDSWIGGSMDISYTHNRIVTCAPRQIRYHVKGEDVDAYYQKGLCYLFHANGTSTKRLFPLEDLPDVSPSVDLDQSVYNAAYGQAGFSVHFPSSKESLLLLGAPGVLNWKGTSVLCSDGSNSDPIASRRRRDISEFGDKIVAAARDNDNYSLFGYSSTSGYFFGKQVLYYVSGAPRAHSYYGRVFVYTFNQRDNYPDMQDSPYGTQFGEYFGAALTAGDINADGFDDLIVAAPFHSVNKFNEGRVYVYMGGSRARFLNPFEIDGRAVNGQFGTCVQFLGDLNADGYGEVAVAAPYEDESGVVYLYTGSKSGLRSEYSQRIVGKDVYSAIRGFGISISRGADIDGNTYSDVAIGAHLSGHVVLLRTNPVVSVNHKLVSLVSNLNADQSEFKMRACYSFTTKRLNFGISIRRILTIDPQFGRAALKNADIMKTVNLEMDREVCEDLTLALQKTSNTFDPISVALSHEFVSSQLNKGAVFVDETGVVGEDHFCATCGMYNEEQSSKQQKIEIPFALGCGSDNICVANLEFESSIEEIGKDNIFILGSKDRLTLKTVVKNYGEKAYLTQLVVNLPEFVHLYITPSACVQNGTSVVCSVASPLEENAQSEVILPLDMTPTNLGRYDGEELNFIVTVLTSSVNNNDNVKKIKIRVEREADVTISGKSEEQSYFYGDVQKPVYFVQRYQVEKFGSSVLNEIRIEIDIPRNIDGNNGMASNFTSLEFYTGKLDDEELSCYESDEFTTYDGQDNISNDTSKNDDHSFYLNCNMPEVECSKLICNVGPIASGQIATIELKLMFNIPLLKNLLSANDVIYFGTRGYVEVTNPPHFIQSGDKPDTVEIISLFVGEGVKEKVAVWIIVLSVLASLILLAICIYVLYKFGFFKRKVKEELDQIKNEVELNESSALQEEN